VFENVLHSAVEQQSWAKLGMVREASCALALATHCCPLNQGGTRPVPLFENVCCHVKSQHTQVGQVSALQLPSSYHSTTVQQSLLQVLLATCTPLFTMFFSMCQLSLAPQHLLSPYMHTSYRVILNSVRRNGCYKGALHVRVHAYCRAYCTTAKLFLTCQP
jgi:hypothetical protein